MAWLPFLCTVCPTFSTSPWHLHFSASQIPPSLWKSHPFSPACLLGIYPLLKQSEGSVGRDPSLQCEQIFCHSTMFSFLFLVGIPHHRSKMSRWMLACAVFRCLLSHACLQSYCYTSWGLKTFKNTKKPLLIKRERGGPSFELISFVSDFLELFQLDSMWCPLFGIRTNASFT